MRAADCRPRFELLSAGGVRVSWPCGAELVNAEETAVDVELLRDRFPSHHHHHLRYHR